MRLYSAPCQRSHPLREAAGVFCVLSSIIFLGVWAGSRCWRCLIKLGCEIRRCCRKEEGFIVRRCRFGMWIESRGYRLVGFILQRLPLCRGTTALCVSAANSGKQKKVNIYRRRGLSLVGCPMGGWSGHSLNHVDAKDLPVRRGCSSCMPPHLAWYLHFLEVYGTHALF